MFVSILVGLPAPRPGLLFARAKSNQKHAQEGDTFDCVPLLRTTPRNDIFKGAPPPRQRGYPPSRLEGGLHPKEREISGATAPHPPQISVGAFYLYKKPLAPGARIKLSWARAGFRVVIAMTVQNP